MSSWFWKDSFVFAALTWETDEGSWSWVNNQFFREWWKTTWGGFIDCAAQHFSLQKSLHLSDNTALRTDISKSGQLHWAGSSRALTTIFGGFIWTSTQSKADVDVNWVFKVTVPITYVDHEWNRLRIRGEMQTSRQDTYLLRWYAIRHDAMALFTHVQCLPAKTLNQWLIVGLKYWVAVAL